MDNIYYHLTFRTRRSRPLSGFAENFLHLRFDSIARRYHWEIRSLVVRGAEVSVVVRADACSSAHLVQYQLKRGSLKGLRRFKEFRRSPSIWTRRYDVESLPWKLPQETK